MKGFLQEQKRGLHFFSNKKARLSVLLSDKELPVGSRAPQVDEVSITIFDKRRFCFPLIVFSSFFSLKSRKKDILAVPLENVARYFSSVMSEKSVIVSSFLSAVLGVPQEQRKL